MGGCCGTCEPPAELTAAGGGTDAVTAEPLTVEPALESAPPPPAPEAPSVKAVAFSKYEAVRVRWHSDEGEVWKWKGRSYLCIQVWSGDIYWEVWQSKQGFDHLAAQLPASCAPMPAAAATRHELCGQLARWLAALLRDPRARGKAETFLAYAYVAFEHGGGGYRMPDPGQAQAVEMGGRPLMFYRHDDDDVECGLTDSEGAGSSCCNSADSDGSSSDSDSSDCSSESGSSDCSSESASDSDSDEEPQSRKAPWPQAPGPRVVLPRRLRGGADGLLVRDDDTSCALRRAKQDLEREDGRLRGVYGRSEVRLREALLLQCEQALLEVRAGDSAAAVAAEAREGLREIAERMRQDCPAAFQRMLAAVRGMNSEAERCEAALGTAYDAAMRAGLLRSVSGAADAGAELAAAMGCHHPLERQLAGSKVTVIAAVARFLPRPDRAALAVAWSGGHAAALAADSEGRTRQLRRHEWSCAVTQDSVVLGTSGERYTVARLIAEGGFGKVFAATAADGDPVVLKVLRGGWHYEREALTELAACGSAHFNVLQLLGEVRLSCNANALVFPEYDGDLEDIRLCRALELREVAAQLVHALDWLHSKKWAHTDLKPPNILLKGLSCGARRAGRWESGGRITAVIADLGSAWPLEPKQRHLIASPGYRAPEVRAGRPWGTGVDVYALGITLLETLTGIEQSAPGRLRIATAVRAAADSDAWGCACMATVVDGMLCAAPASRPSARQLLTSARHGDFFGAERAVLTAGLDIAAKDTEEEMAAADEELIAWAAQGVRAEDYEAAGAWRPGVRGGIGGDVRRLRQCRDRLVGAVRAAADVARRATEEKRLGRRSAPRGRR
eukprot:TRINITY_DN14084_c1_g1_i3.p1 TRINITY_DN14084_c1_g1~~TRINITY_DN14084_c1_g1_i3.p1  ORF type:complete len:872 (+),score=244.26 TRINITY_DN14084_c1_g1_i3:87-2618(+)